MFGFPYRGIGHQIRPLLVMTLCDMATVGLLVQISGLKTELDGLKTEVAGLKDEDLRLWYSAWFVETNGVIYKGAKNANCSGEYRKRIIKRRDKKTGIFDDNYVTCDLEGNLISSVSKRVRLE